MAVVITTVIASWGAGDITEETLTKAKRSAMEIVDTISNLQMLPAHRQVEASYRGVMLQRGVNSIAEEISWKLACFWKGLAVEQKKLEPFCFEPMVVHSPKADGKGKVHDSMVTSVQIARSSAQTTISGGKGREGGREGGRDRGTRRRRGR